MNHAPVEKMSTLKKKGFLLGVQILSTADSGGKNIFDSCLS